MKIALVCGMLQEAAILGHPDNAIVIVGAGNAEKLAADLEAAIAGGCDHVLSFGTCGALNPALKVGDLVVAGLMVDPPSPGIFCDAAWSKRLRDLTGARPVVGTVSVATVATAADKAALYAATKADVVDMESLIAARSKARGIPFAMLRAVSDAANQDIPAAALAAMDKMGGVNWQAVIWTLFDTFSSDHEEMLALLKLANSAEAAFEALAKALANIGINFGVPAP
jgi:hypothetical protein